MMIKLKLLLLVIICYGFFTVDANAQSSIFKTNATLQKNT